MEGGGRGGYTAADSERGPVRREMLWSSLGAVKCSSEGLSFPTVAAQQGKNLLRQEPLLHSSLSAQKYEDILKECLSNWEGSIPAPPCHFKAALSDREENYVYCPVLMLDTGWIRSTIRTVGQNRKAFCFFRLFHSSFHKIRRTPLAIPESRNYTSL